MNIPTPKGLGPAGKKLWRAVVEDFDPEQHERLLLEQAASVADTIAALSAAVGAELIGGNGRIRPELVELRQQRIILARLLAAMRLEADGDSVQVLPQRRAGFRGTYGPRSVS